MRLLLDTHVFLWWLHADARLPTTFRVALHDLSNERYLSSVTAAEVAVKTSLGKLKLPDAPEAIFRNGMEKLRAFELPLRTRHSLRLSDLPFHHRDPFDRLLIAQALEEGMTLVTADPQMRAYDVPLIARE